MIRFFVGPLKSECYQSNMQYKDPVRTSQETHCLRYEAQPVKLFRGTVAVYCENHTEHINALCGDRTQNSCSVKAAGTHSYQRVWLVLVQEEIATRRETLRIAPNEAIRMFRTGCTTISTLF
jgi:hypothetical protein